MVKGKKIFLTGGAGFIGSHIAEELIKEGAEVTIYDNFSFGKKKNIEHLKEIQTIEGDILDFKKLKESMKGHDIVSHHAAQLEIFLSMGDPKKDLETNTIGTLNVLKAAKENNIKRIINASSACIYGETEDKKSEEDSTHPNWEYGVSKLAAEKYANIYNNYHEMEITHLRYSIVYGEREWYRRVLTIFIKRALTKQPLIVFGEGEAIRDMVYVKDLVEAHNLCLKKDIAKGKAYNISSCVPISILNLAKEVVNAYYELFGEKIEIMFEDTSEGEFSRLVSGKKRNSAELKKMLLDNRKAKEELGWEPKIDLKEGLKKEILWAKDNLEGWEKITYS